MGDVKTRRFLDVFVVYSTLFLVPGTIFGARDPRYTVSGATSKLIIFASLGRFRGMFWVPGTIYADHNLRYTVSGPTSKLVIFAFFVGYSTLFWVTGTIFGASDLRYII